MLLPWLFLEQFLSAFRITEKSKDQRKRHRETAHGKQNKTKQTHKPAKEQAFLTFIDQINSQKKTRKKKKKENKQYCISTIIPSSNPPQGMASSLPPPG